MWIDNASQVDILFYEPYANVIAEIAKNPNYKPLTIGVFGIWGAGKSTLLNLVEERASAEESGKINICININAWAFEGYEDAKIAIIESLLHGLKEKAPDGIRAKMRDYLKSLFKRVDFFKTTTKAIGYAAPIVAGLASGNPVPVVLGVSGTAAEIGQTIKEASSAVQTVHDECLKEKSDSAEGSLVNNIRKFREEFEKALINSGIDNVIVLIDDLDRCQPDRIIDTLEAIKLFLSVKKTVFVIAADENVIQYAIRKKYPPLDNFTVNLDKEYIEKIVQLPIYIPELSPKDIENYLMLLVPQDFCDAGDFKRIIDGLRSEEIRISEDVIDLAKLKDLSEKYIPEEKRRSFYETATIVSGVKGIVAGNLKGNPRQAKRFLNTFTTKSQLAELYYGKGTLDLKVLAKLLVLQKLNPDLFIELNEWNKRATTINEEYQKMRETLAKEQEEAIGDEKYKAWRIPTIKKWVECEPVELEKIRLDRYFYLTRESLRKAEIDISALSANVKNILTKIGNATVAMYPSIIGEMQGLTATDLNDIMKVLLEKIAPGNLELSFVEKLFESFEGYREQIFSSLLKTKNTFSLAAIPHLRKMRNVDQAKIDDLLQSWNKNGKISERIIEEIRKKG